MEFFYLRINVDAAQTRYSWSSASRRRDSMARCTSSLPSESPRCKRPHCPRRCRCCSGTSLRVHGRHDARLAVLRRARRGSPLAFCAAPRASTRRSRCTRSWASSCALRASACITPCGTLISNKHHTTVRPTAISSLSILTILRLAAVIISSASRSKYSSSHSSLASRPRATACAR